MHTNPVFSTTTSLDFAEGAPSFVVRVGYGGANIAFSNDGGASWSPASNPPSGASGGFVGVAANGSRVLWGSSAGVFFSTDQGNTWTASLGIPAGARVRADRVNPSKFYGFANGTFYVSTDGAASFVASPASLPSVSSAYFKTTPGNEGDIWLAAGTSGLWHSIDNGQSFTKIPIVDSADNIGFGMPAPKKQYSALYASAHVQGVGGIYRSDDGGKTWIRINDNKHQYGSTTASITGDPRVYGRVYFTTNGRGIIYGDINTGP